MTTSSNATGMDSRNDRLDEIIAEYLRQTEAGDLAAADALLAANSEFANELCNFFENHARIGRVMHPLKACSIADAVAATADLSPSPSPSSLSSTVETRSSRPLLDGTRYRLDRFHDRGGMGEIWVGHDQRLGRDVAVKVLRRERSGQRERFAFEAQVSGQLEHPGIVRVYDYDLDQDGHPFYVMQFVRGRTLREAIEACFAAGNPDLESHRLLEAMVDICDIVAYAHSRGVLHRDLKPANVMLGAFGETLVLDWGLAKVENHKESATPGEFVRPSGSGSSETQAGAVIGSPSYLSPEAASGHIEQVDQASDVYLLGATLYEILTCQPPRQGSSHHEMMDLARNTDPPAPRTLVKAIPRPLEAICQKAMSRSKLNRYATALEMATDLRRFLAGDQLSAYREGPLERLARWSRRHRRMIGYAGIAMVLSFALAFGAAKWYEARRLKTYDLFATEIDEFRELDNEVHYLIAAIDPMAETVPYFQASAGEQVARRALSLSDGWGNDLSRMSLSADPIAERRSKDQLKQEIYELSLVLVQSLLHHKPSSETATESLAILERTGATIVPTASFYRLKANCFRLLDDTTQENLALKVLQDASIPRSALDHFLQGESLRRSTWEASQGVSIDDSQSTRQLQLERALGEYELAVSIDPRHYWSHLQIGRCLMGLDRYSEAIQAFGACIALRPKQSWAFASRGLAYALAGDTEQALNDVEGSIGSATRSQPELLLNRGFVYLLRNDDDRALQDFDRILSADDLQHLPGALYYRSQILERRGQLAAAMKDQNELLASDPEFTRAYLERARLHFKLGSTVAAMSDLDAYLSRAQSNLSPQPWVSPCERGQLILKIVDTIPFANTTLRETLESLAMEQFQAAIRLGSDREEPFKELGRLYFLSGEHDAASEVYDQGLRHCPESEDLHLSRGWLLSESDTIAAAKDFEATLRLDPGNGEALAALGYIQAKRESADTAERLAMESLLRPLTNYLELFNIACIYGELGETDPQNKARHHRDAILILTRAINLWHQSGSPADQSIPELIKRERSGAFRSLNYAPVDPQ